MISKITLKNGVRIINDSYVIKKKKRVLTNKFNYLLSRSFDYFPKVIREDDNNIYYEYISDIEEPKEQKMTDLIGLLSLLHNKTTFYKEIDIDWYKSVYEDVNKRINDIYNYYNYLIDKIDREVYMSPADYLIARNISYIYNILGYARDSIDRWYKINDDKRKIRVVMVHNNLSLDHYLKNDKPYFISWDKSMIDIPVYDLVNLYRKYYLDFEFDIFFRIYLSKYPFNESEMALFLSLIAIPDKIQDTNSEYIRVLNIRRVIDYVYKTIKLLEKYCIKEKTNENQKFNKEN